MDSESRATTYSATLLEGSAALRRDSRECR